LREHAIRDDADYAAHLDYVHYNPVKHGLVTAPGDCRIRRSEPAFDVVSIRSLGSTGVLDFPAGERWQ
jgi:hypothetical protein